MGNHVVRQLPHNRTVPEVPTNVLISSVAPRLGSSSHSSLASDFLDGASPDGDPIPGTQRQESGIDSTEDYRPAKKRGDADIQDDSTFKTTSEGLTRGGRYEDVNLDCLSKADLEEVYGERRQVATKPARVAAHNDTLNPHGNPTSSKSVRLENCREVDIHYIRLPSHRFGDYPNGTSDLTAFPQKLLDDVSFIVANDRERASHTSPQCGIDKWDKRITRNKVNVICHLMMIIQKQYASIAKWENRLPGSPQNQKQFHAARYRSSQLRILNTVFNRLRDMLRDLSGVIPVPRDVRVVRLEHILAESPSGFATDFRNALKVGLGTRKVTKIREAGWVDLVFTLWVCGLWVWNSELDREDKEELGQVAFNARIFQWLGFLQTTYWKSLLSLDEHQLHGYGGNAGAAEGEDSLMRGLESSSSNGGDPTSVTTESQLIAESYLAVVRVAAASDPDSMFARQEWTVDFLAWGLDIVTQEGFMCLNLEGKEGDDSYDEYMLFMECGQDRGNFVEDAAGDATGDGAGDGPGDTAGGATGNDVTDTAWDAAGNATMDVVRDIAGNAARDAADSRDEDTDDVNSDMRDAPPRLNTFRLKGSSFRDF